MEFVTKRDGTLEEVKFDKVYQRINKMTFGLNTDYVSVHSIAKKVIGGIYNKVTTEDLDILTVKVAGAMVTQHPDYGLLAGRIALSNLKKKQPKTFSEAIEVLYNYHNPSLQRHTPIVSKQLFDVVMANREMWDGLIVEERDWNYNIFAVETLKKSYLLKTGNVIVETPQYLHLRVALGLNIDSEGVVDVEGAVKTYEATSTFQYTHATPTLFNAGTSTPQLASCFLINNKGDSIEGIYDTIKESAIISKHAGGIGVSVHDVRSNGSYIAGTNGRADGIIPMLRLYNETCKYVNQAGKRKGSIAVYLEPHHPDIFDFLDLRKGHGPEETRCKDLFTALWMSDLFMERVNAGMDWTLMDPNTTPGLNKVHGDEYRNLYEKYEKEGRGIKVVKAQSVWTAICNSLIETGTPYILNKDSVNRLSNQKNLGTIQSSNLCAEIVQFTSPDETAVCMLASLNTSAFVREDLTYDFDALADMASLVTKNLNKAIDIGFYPTETARTSMTKHRPIGIGINALADTFFKLNLAFTSPEAEKLNKNIAEAIYFGAVRQSVEEAKLKGPYDSYTGSPASQGKLQFDLWVENAPNASVAEKIDTDRLEWGGRWDALKADMKIHGLRNSLLTAYMPTASSATLMGVYESFEVQTSNIYRRSVLSGEFVVINKYLVDDLIKIGQWNDDVVSSIIKNDGSVQHLDWMDAHMREKYKTVWEISMKTVINQSFGRSPFVDQSQSLNMYLRNPTVRSISSMLFYSQKLGLKTLSYYLRSRAASEAVKFVNNSSCDSCSA